MDGELSAVTQHLRLQSQGSLTRNVLYTPEVWHTLGIHYATTGFDVAQ